MQNNNSQPQKIRGAKPRDPIKKKRNQKQVAAKIVSKYTDPDRLNPYLMTLIDPENKVGVRYPDSLPKGTAVFRGLINYNAFYFADNTIEPAGTYLHVVSPTLINPILEYRADTVALRASSATDGFAYILQSGVVVADDSQGLFPLLEDTATPATASDQMWLPRGTSMNYRGQWHYDDQDFTVPPLRGIRPIDSTVFYGFPVGMIEGGATPGVLEVIVTTATPATAVTAPLGVMAVTTTGSYTFPVLATTVGQTRFQFGVARGTAGFDALFPGTGRYIGLPGIGIRLVGNPQNDQLITSIVVRVAPKSNDVTNTTLTVPRFQGVSLPDEATYAETIDQYRVVSASEWMEYDGSDLNNGGQCASIMYRGGQSPFENGLFNYPAVAVAPEAYAGCLKHGTYSIWAPNSENDMLMRPLNPHDRWEFPFICNTGVVATPTQLNALRVRVALNYEVVSTSQFYSFEKPIPHPEYIEEAAMVLRRYPCTMANGRHWDWIKNAANDLMKFGKNTVKWADENKSWLLPAASAAAALI